MSRTIKLVLEILGVLTVFTFSILMLSTISQYLSFETNIGFLQFKQQIVGSKFWLAFFYIHIFSVVICLLAGLTQFSSAFLKTNRKAHRIIGKIYAYNILVVNVPACFVLAVFSNGGFLGISGFVIQNLLWAFFTLGAILQIRKGNIAQHRNFMVFSYAITTTALTFRILKNLIFNESRHSYELFYGLNVWISLAINLAIAWLIVRNYKDFSPFERNRLYDDHKRNGEQNQ
ncbi:DUF2306 domain-containing protein [Flavobacterium sp.]|uniref:DUF2306 domain-containing protein n=1 Tax=Flavobacterium sp. TaxID=239 RepID=UPI001226C293|nr:DUF2306 domain-containing protein [Flavobacterium sp.]RZJ72502.1 MAG: DUF2306 domain-containing protein [Flavobacterium sp.]